jgi:hypothetical protein
MIMHRLETHDGPIIVATQGGLMVEGSDWEVEQLYYAHRARVNAAYQVRADARKARSKARKAAVRRFLHLPGPAPPVPPPLIAPVPPQPNDDTRAVWEY